MLVAIRVIRGCFSSILSPFLNKIVINALNNGVIHIFAPMKLLSILLIAYLFLLSAFPCQDECNITAADCISVQHNYHASSCDNEQQKCHNCSPFCFCNCCHVNTITNVEVASQPLLTAFNELSIIYIEKKNDLFNASIWQPPKIG
jgi:hypothetical protein